MKFFERRLRGLRFLNACNLPFREILEGDII